MKEKGPIRDVRDEEGLRLNQEGEVPAVYEVEDYCSASNEGGSSGGESPISIGEGAGVECDDSSGDEDSSSGDESPMGLCEGSGVQNFQYYDSSSDEDSSSGGESPISTGEGAGVQNFQYFDSSSDEDSSSGDESPQGFDIEVIFDWSDSSSEEGGPADRPRYFDVEVTYLNGSDDERVQERRDEANSSEGGEGGGGGEEADEAEVYQGPRPAYDFLLAVASAHQNNMQTLIDNNDGSLVVGFKNARDADSFFYTIYYGRCEGVEVSSFGDNVRLVFSETYDLQLMTSYLRRLINDTHIIYDPETGMHEVCELDPRTSEILARTPFSFDSSEVPWGGVPCRMEVNSSPVPSHPVVATLSGDVESRSGVRWVSEDSDNERDERDLRDVEASGTTAELVVGGLVPDAEVITPAREASAREELDGCNIIPGTVVSATDSPSRVVPEELSLASTVVPPPNIRAHPYVETVPSPGIIPNEVNMGTPTSDSWDLL